MSKSSRSFLTWLYYCPLKTRLTLDQVKGASLGQLWLELLRFYTLEFALEEHIISIRLKELLSREVKNWPRRRLAIEGKEWQKAHGLQKCPELTLSLFLVDPFALKRNVARSLNSQMVFEYIQERFRTAYKYFACPQRRNAAGYRRGQKMGKRSPQTEESGRKEAALVKKEEDEGKSEKSGWHNLKEDEESDSDDEDDHSDQSTKKDEKTLDVSLMDMALSEGSEPSFSPKTLLDSVKKGEEEEEEGRVLDVTSEELYYVFDKMIFTGGKVIIETHISLHLFT